MTLQALRHAWGELHAFVPSPEFQIHGSAASLDQPSQDRAPDCRRDIRNLPAGTCSFSPLHQSGGGQR